MPEDAVLHAERDHLARSHSALAAMRARAADWTTAIGGDHVSTQFLRQQLYRRRESLADDPDVPLFFGGRMDAALEETPSDSRAPRPARTRRRSTRPDE